MRLLRLLFVFWIGVWQFSTALLGGEFHLTNGDIVRGEPVSFDDDGMIVRLSIGGYSSRIGWSKLTQDTLKELAKNPEASKLVEPFIDEPPVQKEKAKKPVIVIKPVPRVNQLAHASVFASFSTPAGIAVLLVLFLGNLYAAYEVARYRNRSPGLVCGLSVVLPFVAPAIFLATPSAPPAEEEAAGMAEAPAATQAGKSTTGSLAKAPMASGLSIAQQAKGGSAAPGQEQQSYKRGEFTFNRRFFETKFPSFFRVVPNDADLVLVIRSPKEEYVVKRISRITSNEMHLQLLKGGNEVSMPFAEVTEVHVRHKDAVKA